MFRLDFFKPSRHTFIVFLALCLCVALPALVSNVVAFRCYICDSKNDIECTEKLPYDTRLTPKDCGNITGVKYCIKTTNLYGGELGTKRFCASNDQGSYCRYVRQPTGDREFRSCVLTCNSEACNGSSSLINAVANVGMVVLSLSMTILATIHTSVQALWTV